MLYLHMAHPIITDHLVHIWKLHFLYFLLVYLHMAHPIITDHLVHIWKLFPTGFDTVFSIRSCTPIALWQMYLMFNLGGEGGHSP
jgi:hypothetical protein